MFLIAKWCDKFHSALTFVQFFIFWISKMFQIPESTTVLEYSISYLFTLNTFFAWLKFAPKTHFHRFVHMEELQEATEAIEALNETEVNGQTIKVEKAAAKPEEKKIWVGNLEGKITADDLRPLFEKYGTVTECECMGKFA